MEFLQHRVLSGCNLIARLQMLEAAEFLLQDPACTGGTAACIMAVGLFGSPSHALLSHDQEEQVALHDMHSLPKAHSPSLKCCKVKSGDRASVQVCRMR